MSSKRTLELKIFPQVVPDTEFCLDFVQGMYNRMCMSFFRYGKVAEGFPDKVNALKSMEKRLEEYHKTGNREFLMDAANFLMIEFMHPKKEDTFYKATDSKESPGRQLNTNVQSTKHNKDLR